MAKICFHCFKMKQDEDICPYCGYHYDSAGEKYPLALKPGTILTNRYLLGRVLGQGGFGVTYIALDQKTRSRVAIKEYLPTEMVSRDPANGRIILHSGDRIDEYVYGKNLFLEEARTLSEFNGNEHIIKILNYFEENDTAYFAMEYIEGQTLKQYLLGLQRPLRVEEANYVLLPIMEALDWVHSKRIVHRDISPDNIMIRTDGISKLIDFGAARNSTGEKSRSLDVVLKHGFAPKEQYTRRGRQGPFTDVYALAATYYYAITGKIPPDAIERSEKDELIPPSKNGAKIRGDTEKVLLKALSISSADRYQSMADFYHAMLQTMPSPFSPEATKSTMKERLEWVKQNDAQDRQTDRHKSEPSAKQHQRMRIGIIVILAAMIVPGAVFAKNLTFMMRKTGTLTPIETIQAETEFEFDTTAGETIQPPEEDPDEQSGTGGVSADSHKNEDGKNEPGYEETSREAVSEHVQEKHEEMNRESELGDATTADSNNEGVETYESISEQPFDNEKNDVVTDESSGSEENIAGDEAQTTEVTEHVSHEFDVIGSVVTLGHYEQDNVLDNGKEEIEWIVLDVQEKKSLLLSRFALDCRQYDQNYSSITWENASLRRWLNNEFMTEAFQAEQRTAIVTDYITNGDTQGNKAWQGRGGANTKDAVFLLSYVEVTDYFPSTADRACRATEYAVSHGAFTYNGGGKYSGNCWWWLRSPGSTQFNAAGVRHDGTIIDDYVTYQNGSIRPAIWVDRDLLQVG